LQIASETMSLSAAASMKQARFLHTPMMSALLSTKWSEVDDCVGWQ